ncbi:MAG: zinc ABC transporter substrate-binding protein [Cyclobacteriaceae bacterium]
MKYLYLVIFSILLGCNTAEKTANDKPKIVTSTGMLYDAVINIVGDKMEAEALMGPGVDPHLYKATQGDLSKLREADIIVINGLLLEGKMGEILKQLGKSQPVVAAAESIPDSLLRSSLQYEDAYDPHVWFDVSLWKYAVNEIGAAIVAYDEPNKKYYQTNLEKYISQLDDLHAYVKREISSIPKEKRVLITAHDAFGYFGAAYDIRVEGVQGLSTVSDFGLRDISDISDIIIKNNVSAIFVESSVSDKAIKAVMQGCNDKGHEVKIGGSLFSDAMGALGTVEGTYIGMVQHNTKTIVQELSNNVKTDL